MGLLDFVKDAGDDLFKKLGSDVRAGAEALKGKVRDLGLDVDGLEVKVDGDKAVLEGKAASQADREKAILAAGNQAGIAHVEDRIEVATAEPESQYHKVVSGDTLSKIAKQYYGDPMKYPVLFEANRPMLKDPDEIYPGQVLRIPPQGE